MVKSLMVLTVITEISNTTVINNLVFARTYDECVAIFKFL